MQQACWFPWRVSWVQAQDHQCLSFLQSNGSDERFNQTLKHQLQRLVNGLVCLPIKSSGLNEVNTLPTNVWTSSSLAYWPHSCTTWRWGSGTRLWAEIAKNAGTSKEAPWTSIFANIQKAQARQKKQYEAKHNTDTRITVGDKVLVKSMKNESRRVESLSLDQFTGPNTVAKDIGKGRYRLQDHNGNLLKTAINCHHLKICHDPDGGSVSFVCTQRQSHQWPLGCARSKWGLVLTQFSRH